MSNSTFLLIHPYKIVSSFIFCLIHSIYTYPFPDSHSFSFFSSPSPFVQPSCYFKHWTPVIHSHPLISFHLLSVSCPLLSFIFCALSHVLHFLCHCFFHFSISLSVQLSNIMLLLFLSPFFILFAHPYTSKAFCFPLSVMMAVLPHLSSFSIISFRLSLLNACLTSTGLYIQRCGIAALPAFCIPNPLYTYIPLESSRIAEGLPDIFYYASPWTSSF